MIKKKKKWNLIIYYAINAKFSFSSNIGKVCIGREDIFFYPKSSVKEYGYWTCLYCLNNEKTLSVILVHPFNVEENLIKEIYNSLIEIINFIKNDK